MAKGGKISPATEFKKGQSGNPKGRPKKLPDISDILAEVLGDEKDGLTALKAILIKYRNMAISGNLRAGEILMERAYGKAKQVNEITGKDGAAIELNTTKADYSKLSTEELELLLRLEKKASNE